MMDGADTTPTSLPLAALHSALGAKFVPFAGYAMPVQYARGVMGEHLWCRAHAGLFDVSHMGQILLPPGADARLEAEVPVDILGLPEGRQRYGFLTNAEGGIRDDMMIARGPEGLFLVVNGACKADDIAHLRGAFPDLVVRDDRALLALQGPEAEAALAALIPAVAQMRFMDSQRHGWQGAELWISRSGYTGEDGFEISLPIEVAEGFAQTLLADARVEPIGLGARDSLRLEAGLPLYGQDMDATISPVEAGQAWAIGKVRRAGGARAGGFAGEARIFEHLSHGAPRRRVGLRPEGRAPMRAGVALFDAAGTQVGQITSGGYGPSVEGPIAMGLIAADTATDAPLFGEMRGKRHPVAQVPLPFIPPSYKR